LYIKESIGTGTTPKCFLDKKKAYMCQNPDEVNRIDRIDGIVIKNEILTSANLFILEIYLIFTYM